MAKLSPEARAALDGFVAARTPEPGRRHRNLEATLARLDDDPLAEPVLAHRRWAVVAAVAAAVALAIGVGSLLAGSIAQRDGAATPAQAASAPVATPPRDAEERAPAVLPSPNAPAVPTVTPELPPTPATPPEPAVEVAAPDPAARPSRPRDGVRTPPSVAEQLALETALLSRIRRAVDTGADAEALGLLRQHAREFPRGAMLEDRQAMLAIVGCRSGVAAATDASAFLRAHPRSPYAAAVRQACASRMPG